MCVHDRRDARTCCRLTATGNRYLFKPRSTGSMRTRTTGALRALRTPCASCKAAARSAPADRGTRISARTSARPSTRAAIGRNRHRAKYLRVRRHRRRGDQLIDSISVTEHLGDRHGRRETERHAFGEFALGVTDRIPAHQGLHCPQRTVAEHHDASTVGSGRNKRGRVQPAPHCFLAGPQVGSLQQRPAVEQQRRAVTAIGHRLGARGRDHQSRTSRHDVEYLPLRGGADNHAGKGSTEFFGRTTRADDGRPIAAAAAFGTLPAGRDPPTPPAGRCAPRAGTWPAGQRRPHTEGASGNCRTTAPADNRDAGPE